MILQQFFTTQTGMQNCKGRASNKLREKLKSHYLFLCLIAMKVVQKRTNCRIGNGAEAFGNLSTIWKSSTISTSLKNKLVQLIGTFHCIMYGSETWQFFQKTSKGEKEL
jgi:hypothetical protein